MPRPALHRSLFVAALLIAPSCVTSSDPVRTSIVTSLAAPRGLLDRASQLELRVLEGELSCDEATGTLSDEDAARELLKRNLSSSGCAPDVRFCGDVSVPTSAAVRVFEAKAVDGGGRVLAVGCTSAAVDDPTISIAITMFRYLEPAVCGDDVIQPTEQCEPGGTALCDESCQSVEVLLSAGASGNGTSTGKAGDKTDPSFLWPIGTSDAGRFLAFYTDRATPGANVEVGLRVMSADLSPVKTPPALASGPIFLPNGGAFPPTPAPGRQSMPRAAALGGKYYVVFQDDDSPGDSGLDIHLRVIDRVFQSEQGHEPLYVNGGPSGEPNIQTAPAIAASSDRLLVVWEDEQRGAIVARTLTPPANALGSQNQISTGTGNRRPEVAATGKGWVTAWTSNTGAKVRAVNADGTPSGSEMTVNASGAGAEGATIASLPDGRFAVAWSQGGDIFIQRFDAKGVPLSGDQDRRLNDLVSEGAQTQPAIAPVPSGAGAYVVAWHDASTGHVRARFVGGSGGFLYNHVNGQTSEFQASRAEGRKRASPTVAVGGDVDGAAAVAIGWEDRSASGAGIVVRRFPLPTE